MGDVQKLNVFIPKDFAIFYNESSVIERWRFVHYRDPVPHLPPEYVVASAVEAREPHDLTLIPPPARASILRAFDYYHSPTEVFYKENYTGPDCLKVCDSSGEDPTCSDQYDFDIVVSDHLHYLDILIDTEAC